MKEDGIDLLLADQTAAGGVIEESQGDIDLLVADLSVGMPGYDSLLVAGRSITHRIGLSPETPADFTTIAADAASEFRRYLSAVCAENFISGMRFLAAQTGMTIDYDPPQNVVTTGIYHPDAAQAFEDVAAYRRWFSGRVDDPDTPWIGILFYYSQLAEENTDEVDAVILALEAHGLAPLCVFGAGAEEASAASPDGPPWLELFRQAPGIEVLLSFMAGRLLKTSDQVDLLKGLDVPIIQLLRAHSQTPDQWRDDPQGLPGMTTVFSLAQPETFGAVAPVMVAGSLPPRPGEPMHGWRTFIPIADRIHTLCHRVLRWVRLRHLPNTDKRVTIVLHNNPCKGVEATVGMAVGLDTFDSLALLIQKMGAAGYDIGQAPATGRELLEAIMRRKAVAEFRWTTVDEIIANGGDLYRMDREEYMPWFNRLPEAARQRVLADWDDFPGLSMAYNDDGEDVLVITGIQYGKVRIMLQPKRGCYGPKCTGEVCRILHDPELAPPHHWLAVYKYIQENSDAVVHFGTEGALEFLPGKQAGLGESCFPEISIGDLPNLYVYAMDVTGEGLTAKRRGQAVLVDHLTPVYRPAPLDAHFRQLSALLEEYAKAKAGGESRRLTAIGRDMAPLMVDCGLVETAPEGDALEALVDTARRQIARMRKSLMPEGLHTLSTPPERKGVAKMLATLLQTPPPGLPDMHTIAEWSAADESTVYDRAAAVLEELLSGGQVHGPEVQIRPLADFCNDVADRVAACHVELDQLLRGLAGGFIAPGLSGAPSSGKIEALPTGRNFFATDVTVLPTKAAWEIGRQMADSLLLKYLSEENRFPESVGVSIWSSDAFKSDGELLCQILYLMGARPVWDSQGRVHATEAIDLESLTLTLSDGSQLVRPRVDVTIQTSSIMRDLVPNFCELMDRTVMLVSALDEPTDRNMIRKHTQEQMNALRERTDEQISDAKLQRMASVRVFSTAPGTYGLGVGLALDASAWQATKDLAEIYINWGGHAYTADDSDALAYGMESRQVLADQLARIDVTYMKQGSAEYDVLDCGCYAVSQGGMAAAAAAVGKKPSKCYWGDSTFMADNPIEDLADTIQRSARTKLLNSAWIAHMRAHGYQGAQNAASRVNNLFKWSATSGEVSKQLFDDVVRTYIMDEENRRWLREENPYALEEITRRLLEAASRELWAADEEMLAQVQSAALEIEGDMEELMGDVDGEFQGSKVEVLTAGEVEKWKLDWKLGDR